MDIKNFSEIANIEFEAKAIIGIIKTQTKKGMWTPRADKVAHKFGQNAMEQGNVSGYYKALKRWHTLPNQNKLYKRRTRGNSLPILLQKIINSKRK